MCEGRLLRNGRKHQQHVNDSFTLDTTASKRVYKKSGKSRLVRRRLTNDCYEKHHSPSSSFAPREFLPLPLVSESLFVIRWVVHPNGW